MPPKMRSASVTTGLKCAPDTGPNARISATSPAPVAIEFSRSCRPTSFGDIRCAAMPDPTTIATRKPEPSASAVALRARVAIDQPQQRAADSGAERAAHLVGGRVGIDRPQLAGRHLDVGEHRVDLPRLTVGRVDPDLVLDREAARHLVLGRAGEALVGEARVRGRRRGRSTRPRRRGGSACRARRRPR